MVNFVKNLSHTKLYDDVCKLHNSAISVDIDLQWFNSDKQLFGQAMVTVTGFIHISVDKINNPVWFLC